MTIQGPPNDETPPPTPTGDDEQQPQSQEPEMRAPGEDSAPVGAPRDEPGPGAAA